MDKLLKASLTFTGTIIGAGILGLPYAISKPGFALGLINMILVSLVMLLISLMFGEITLRTKEPHQLPGLVGKYIGKKTEYLVTILSIISMYGALAAYIEGNGKLISNFLQISPLISKLLFFLPFAAIIYFGIKGVEESETVLTLVVIFSIVALSLASLFYLNLDNLTYVNFSEFFSPTGVIIFALSGLFAIPQMKEILWLEKNKLKKSILLGFLVPVGLYIFFVFSCIGALGSEIDEIVTISLSKYGIFFLLFGNIFAFFAMSTCFISLGNALREIYFQDFKINKNISFLLSVAPPLISLLGIATFIQILSITGSIFMIPLMIIVLQLYLKTKKIGERKPEYELKIPNFVLYLVAAFLILVMFLVVFSL